MNARLAILLALAAAACGLKVSKEKPAAPEPAYAFPHSPHVDADVACATCHPMDKATKLEANVRHVKVPANASKTKPCADCHERTGAESSSGPNLAGRGSKAYLTAFISDSGQARFFGPKHEMPAFADDLAAADIAALADWLIWLRTATATDIRQLDP